MRLRLPVQSLVALGLGQLKRRPWRADRVFMRVASRGWLPRSLVLGRVERRALVGCFGLLVVILVVTGGNAVLGLGGQSAEKPIRDWLSSAVYILVAVIVALRAVRVTKNRVP